VGAIAGALVAMGLPEEEARYYEQEVRGGRTLVAVKAGARAAQADDLLRQSGAYNVHHRETTTAQSGTTVATSTSTALADATPVQRSLSDQPDLSPTAPTRSAPGRWEDYADTYRERWQQRAGAAGGHWTDVEPGYRFGWEAHADPRYQGRGWAEVEPDLRAEWEARHPNTPWSDARQAVYEAWLHVMEPAQPVSSPTPAP
jgi:hypothetical protein